MKKNLLSGIILVLFSFWGLLFSFSSDAQNDYHLLLQSGKFIPEENIKTLSVRDEVFSSGFFKGKHYVILQFYRLPGYNERESLKAAGVTLIDYIPNLSYTAAVVSPPPLQLLRKYAVRSVFHFKEIHKTFPSVLRGEIPMHAKKQPGMVDVSVISYEAMNASSVAEDITQLGGTMLEHYPHFRTFTIRIPQQNLKSLIQLPWIQWVEFAEAPNQPENLPGRTLHRVSVLNDGPRNLNGDGIHIGIWDGGEVSPHLDFSPSGRLNIIETSSPSQHATHCAGTICGRGLINFSARGMAPNATLYSYDFSGNVQNEMATAIPLYNLAVSSHSYGSSATPTCNLNDNLLAYTTTSRNTDINLNNFPFHLHVHSAGNSQSACSGGYYTITGSGKAAKNNIVVANITSMEVLSSSSSCGPVQDGRIKPEISAMGTSVFSTSTPLNTYTTLSGTSMSTPGVAGSLALLVQRFKQLNGNALPPSTLIKNAILNTAHDLGNPGPDYRFGYGRINALEAVKLLEQNRYVVNNITQGANQDVNITVPAGAVRLRVMLTWNDPAAAANANPALVNDLDLTVIQGSNTTLPWILDKNNPSNNAVRGVDNYSNIEQVTIDNPSSGTYILRVAGTSIPQGPSQQYALTWWVELPYLEIIYPNGNETFNPGTSEIITWNFAGVTGNQTVEYSLDNGASWTTIGTVSAGTSRLSWTVPSANTSTALIRVSSGSLSDVSDVTFRILGTVTGFAGNGNSCNAGEVNFTWNPVTNATHYDIFRLDATGNFVALATNITGTGYTATGLTPGESMWFTIRAKNNSTGAVSQRANAINVTVSTGGGGIGVPGPINGQNNICGNPSAVPYSINPVTGATSYTWTVPPGASIVSGQGTTNIIVNYASGSSSGNVTVSASNGSCSSTPASLAVTVNPEPAPPISGGNQTQNVCLPDPIPTLTATANVPTGHSVIWYNQATGGSVVTSPTLSTAGSITYYAASRNNTTQCESSARTPVTLTITTTAAPTINVSGPTVFCQGSSVVLTSSAANSYSWSNGANTQSITVTTSGSYSVTVNNNGCVRTSGPVNVTVNPLPNATITASGPLSFCEGGSVTLTASSGTSWLWSNGANSQSVSVSTSGNYSVTVTNAFGCSATSSPVNVSVSPRPSVTLSASPFTRLYPGLRTNLTANVTPSGTYTYTWYLNNNLISGASAPALNGIDINRLGSYTVTVANTTGLACANTSPALIIADSAIAKLFILPNPNSGKFDVIYHSPSPTNFTINVYDGKGANVFRKTYAVSSPYQRMPVNIPTGKGIYHVVLLSGNGSRITSGKVVVN